MNFIKYFLLLSISLGSVCFITAPNALAQSTNVDLLNMPIHELDLDRANTNLLLSDLSARYGISIGFEFAKSDNGRRDHAITLHGTLRDVLNSIVEQSGLYEWQLDDGVINVVPIESDRDPIIAELMQTDIDQFTIANGSSRFTVRQSLAQTKAVRRVLAAHGLMAEVETFLSRDFAPLGRGFSLGASNISLKSLLNRIVRESDTRYWVVNRFGDNCKLVVINF